MKIAMKQVVNKNVERKNRAYMEVKIKTPWTWTECVKCGNKFKFEPMFRIETSSFRDISYLYIIPLYGCKECFSSVMDFYDYVLPERKNPDAFNFDKLLEKLREEHEANGRRL